MKILAINGSPRKNGTTQRILHLFLRSFSGEVTAINPYDMRISPCTDCGKCREERIYCPIQDDMQDVYRYIETSDLIIVATPVYYNSVPSPLKALIDRTMCLYNRHFVLGPREPADKKGVLLCTAGKDDAFVKRIINSQIKMFFDVCRSSFVGSFFLCGTDSGRQIDSEEIYTFAYSIGQMLT